MVRGLVAETVITRASRFEIVLSPGFLAALALLVANDWILKPTFPGWWTGKLSDFTGVFAFSIFLECLLSPRIGAGAFVAAATFCVWKLPVSSQLIAGWNEVVPWPIGRTVDYTDFIALGATPLSLLYAHHFRVGKSPTHKPLLRSLVALLSTVAFSATTCYRTKSFEDVWLFEGSLDELTEALDERQIEHYPLDEHDVVRILLWPEGCRRFDADLRVTESEGTTKIHLESIEYDCEDLEERGRDELLRNFRAWVVEPLQLSQAP